MGIHEVGNHLSIDCISGDGTIMELELFSVTPLYHGCAGRIVIRNDHADLAIIDLDQERIDRLRAFLRGETQ